MAPTVRPGQLVVIDGTEEAVVSDVRDDGSFFTHRGDNHRQKWAAGDSRVAAVTKLHWKPKVNTDPLAVYVAHVQSRDGLPFATGVEIQGHADPALLARGVVKRVRWEVWHHDTRIATASRKSEAQRDAQTYFEAQS